MNIIGFTLLLFFFFVASVAFAQSVNLETRTILSSSVSIQAEVKQDTSVIDFFRLTDSFVLVKSSIDNEYVDYLLKKKIPNIRQDSGVVRIYRYGYLQDGRFKKAIFFPSTRGAMDHLQDKAETNPKLLVVHGNISYDFLYRSKIDTPFSQQDFRQHTERVDMNILYKEKYPLKVAFVLRQSNSPFFKNFVDPVISFDRMGYSVNAKEKLVNTISTKLMQNPKLKKLLQGLEDTLKRITALKLQLESPATLQKIIEEKERQSNPSLQPAGANDLVNKNNGLDSLGNSADPMIAGKSKKLKNYQSKIDTLKQSYQKKYDKEKAELDSLIAKAHETQKRVDSIRNQIQRKIVQIKQEAYKATSNKELASIAREQDTGFKVSNFEKQLANIKSFSIGRAPVNYTELTAQNITLTGVNIEYNPSYYIAFAAGKIDYRFRDFFNQREIKNNQYLVMGRMGIGNMDKRAVIVSIFQGRKSIAEYRLSDSVRNYESILGYSVEAIFKKDANNFFSAEFAKSTKPSNGSLSDKQASPLIKFSDKTNMGINIKGQALVTKTNTKLSGFYRRTGEYFQSFSLFSYNTNQLAWMARIDQPLLKNKIGVTLMVRSNDFTNPFAEQTYKTNTVFKSVIVNIQVPKYPFLSIGYYPGTQVYMVNAEKINETAYYILNGSLVYNYSFRQINMNSSFIYNRYFNQATDSGFILYRGVNCYASQRVFLKKLQLQAGYSYTKQSLIEYSTTELSAEYSLKKWLKFGAGAKYNQPVSNVALWGGKALLKIDIKKLGSFHFQYDKSYLPTTNQSLYPIETGRVTWYKYF